MVVRRNLGLIGLVLALILTACEQMPVTRNTGESPPAASPLKGACGGTVVSDGLPPTWARGGWNGVKGTVWPVPWAIGTGGGAVAYLFAIQLVAGGSPRTDGTNNKVLWVVKDAAVSDFVVRGHPLESANPVVEVSGGPSIVDPPSAGCWSFQLSWTAGGITRNTSTINLDVLPKGSVPS